MLEHIRANLHEYYPALPAPHDVQVALQSPPSRRRFTVIFVIGISTSNGTLLKTVIGKAYRITPKPNARDQDIVQKSQREFAFHSKVYEYFANQPEEFAVVRPLDYIPELQALLTEKAPGIDLGKLIHRCRYAINGYSASSDNLRQHFQRCGKWLALLHEGFAQPVHGHLDIAELECQVNRYHQRLIRAGGPQHLADSFREQITALLRHFADTPIKLTQLHGDFKLRHIFVNGDRVTPIDFGNELNGAAFDDVARLLVEIRLLDFGYGMPLRRGIMRDLQQSFLHGYLGSEGRPALLRLYYIIWLWAKWDRRLKKFTTNRHFEGFLRLLGINHIINRTYVCRWFQRVLTAEIALLKRQMGC